MFWSVFTTLPKTGLHARQMEFDGDFLSKSSLYAAMLNTDRIMCQQLLQFQFLSKFRKLYFNLHAVKMKNILIETA